MSSQPQSLALSEGDFVINNFVFEDGHSIPQLTIHYRTIGTLKRDHDGHATNAVLLLHNTSGSGDIFLRDSFAGTLLEPKQLLSTDEYFFIIPDSIEHGKSSKPSDGLRAKFPRYNYTGMIRTQYRLVTEHLQVDHLRLVLGPSMGGMHTWMWATEYPDIMDYCCAIACLPHQISGRNRAVRKAAMDMITTDPEYMGGDYKNQPRGLLNGIIVSLFTMSSPLQWQKAAPSLEGADAYLSHLQQEHFRKSDANDTLYGLDASRDYDPRPKLERITAPFLAINFADDQLNPPELGILEKEMKRVAKGSFVVLPISEKTNGHQTQLLADQWQHHLLELLQGSK